MSPHENDPRRHRREPFSRGPVLVNRDTGCIDHDDVAILDFGDFLRQSIPHARLVPAKEAAVAGGRRAVTLGDFRPRRTRPEALENAVENPTVINTAAHREACSEAGGDHRPFVIRDSYRRRAMQYPFRL